MNEIIIAFGLKLTELESKIDFIMEHSEGYNYDKPEIANNLKNLYGHK